jgi:sporulation protein YlmC with PRC-barrel domain
MNHLHLTPLLVGLAATFLPAQTPAAPASTLGSPTRCKASQLIGLAISNTKNENLGEIQDIVLDGNNRHIAYAVVGFGGFLGMGEKYFAMPWRLLEVRQRGHDDLPRAMLGLDKETLKSAPGFDKGNWPDMADAAWARQVDDYYRLRGEAQRPEGAAEPKGSAPDGTRGVDHAPRGKAFAHRRLSQLIGMDVVDAQHQKLADIEDLVVDTTHATVDAALLSFGGTLGMGESLVLVAADALRLDVAKSVFVFPCTRADLAAMALQGGKLPALNTDTWLTSCREQCAKATGEVVVNGDVIPVDASSTSPVQYADSYDTKKVETITGKILTVGAVRIGDAKEVRVRWRVLASDGREVVVYAAPSSFGAQQSLGLRTGSAVEVTGSPAKYGNQTVLVAGSIKADGKTAALRDDQGRALWLKK